MLRRVLISLALVFLLVLPASAFEVGDEVVLKAANPIGVPLHASAAPSLAGRAADGTRATVAEVADDGRWFRLTLQDGRSNWVVARYLAEPADAGGGEPGQPVPLTPPAVPVTNVWTSAEECKTRYGAGERLAKAEGTIRLATWNIRWFPRGKPEAEEVATDLAWLGCTLAWLQVDAVAVQEIQDDRLAQLATAVLFDELATLGAGAWQMALQGCGGEGSQHVGFLWNTERVALSEQADVWQLNGAASGPAEPCAGNLRPGQSAYLTSLVGKLDAHMVVVHTDSGTSERDFDHRQEGLRRLDGVFADLHARQADGDVVVLGDFNTMGAEGRATAAEEIGMLKRTVGEEAPGYRLVEPQLGCTEYFEGACSWLDHVLVASGMGEGAQATVRVEGYCAMLNGVPLSGAEPAAYTKLSDHCPVIVDLVDVDDD